MEVTALCIRLMLTVLLLLVAQVDFTCSQKADVGFPQVVPNRQQYFEYESIVVSCEGLEGLTGWRVMRNIKGSVTTSPASCSTSTGPCQIKNAFPGPDSGEYWCEIGGKRSNAVNITVTAGSVILESPVLPVMEGDNVTLCCRTKQTSSNLNAEFYKDGHFMESSSTGNMSIHSASRSDEGLYKCNISGAGESAESWLTVRDKTQQCFNTTHQPYDVSQLSLLICVGASFFLMALLPLVGSLLCRNHQTLITGSPNCPSSFQSWSSLQTVATYGVITEPRTEKRNELDPPSD